MNRKLKSAVDAASKQMSEAMTSVLEAANQAGVKDPYLFFESEAGTMYLIDRAHPGDRSMHSSERQKATIAAKDRVMPVVARVKLHCMFGTGAW